MAARADGEYRYELSAVVVTYHPETEGLRRTLLSLIRQEGVRMEIIVADDGSEDNHEAEIRQLFDDTGFTDWKLVMNAENGGTIRNLISGLEQAEGEFTKVLAPGDFLAGADVMRGWLDDMREKDSDWSFAETVNYCTENGSDRIATETAQPVYIHPYLKDNRQRVRWNYVVLDDVAPGCCLTCRTGLQLQYAKGLAEAGNRYAEDYMYRLMMYDGIIGSYYSRAAVFYEYGTGISTGRSRKWANTIFEEYLRMNRLMAERKNPDVFQQRMLKYALQKTSAFAMIFVPGKLRRFLKLQLLPRKCKTDLTESDAWRKKCS